MGQTGTIGIVGGGQLGQMLTQAALKLGFSVVVLDPSDNSPAFQAGAKQIIKNYSEAALSELAGQVDYLTTEFEEGLDPLVLEHLTRQGININPTPKTLALILDKLIQKDYLHKKGTPMGNYAAINNADEAYSLLKRNGGKMVIKTRQGGYDGYGNRVVTNNQEIDQAILDFKGKPLYAEAYISFKKELAIMVARSSSGEISTYPVVETIQKNNICHEVLAPADIDTSLSQKVQAFAKSIAETYDGSGMFAIEMFLTGEGEILLNEVAPRVHNSGHYTIEACQTSQFEQHIRAIANMPFGKSSMTVPYAVMINILGEREGKAEPSGLEEASALPHTTVHIYGKSVTRVGRKMGHITVTADSLREARDTAQKARKLINI